MALESDIDPLLADLQAKNAAAPHAPKYATEDEAGSPAPDTTAPVDQPPAATVVGEVTVADVITSSSTRHSYTGTSAPPGAAVEELTPDDSVSNIGSKQAVEPEEKVSVSTGEDMVTSDEEDQAAAVDTAMTSEGSDTPTTTDTTDMAMDDVLQVAADTSANPPPQSRTQRMISTTLSVLTSNYY
jgi:hypothetical protein